MPICDGHFGVRLGNARREHNELPSRPEAHAAADMHRGRVRAKADVHANRGVPARLYCCRYDREPARDLNLLVRLDGMSGQERKDEIGDFIVLLVQGEMAGVE